MSQGGIISLHPTRTITVHTQSGGPLCEVPNPIRRPSQSSRSRLRRARKKPSSNLHDIYEEKESSGPEREPSNRSPPPQASLLEGRADALHTLSLCRTVITSLELTRMRKSRLGYSYWLSFWQRMYDRSFVHALGNVVISALSKVDSLFREISKELHKVTVRMEDAVTTATTESEILRILESMETDVSYLRKRRRRKAQHVIEKMVIALEAIPVTVSNTLVEDMKRGVFALDVNCDYYPGDPLAEDRERMGPEQFLQQQHPGVANAPAQYHRRRPVHLIPASASRFYLPVRSADDPPNSEVGNDDENSPTWRSRENLEIGS